MCLREALISSTVTSDNPTWDERAGSLAELAQEQLVDPETAALGERFGPDWTRPAKRADRFVWPGHLYEWAFLLLDWPDADAAARAAAMRLIEVSERTGVDARGVTMFALGADLAPVDRGARLWSQTERLRACARGLRGGLRILRPSALHSGISGVRRLHSWPFSTIPEARSRLKSRHDEPT